MLRNGGMPLYSKAGAGSMTSLSTSRFPGPGTSLLLAVLLATAAAPARSQAPAAASAAAAHLLPLTATADGITYELLSCQGSRKSGRVQLRLRLTNPGPPRRLQFEQVTALDLQGESYRTANVGFGNSPLGQLPTGLVVSAAATLPRVPVTVKELAEVRVSVFKLEPGRTLDFAFSHVPVTWQ